MGVCGTMAVGEPLYSVSKKLRGSAVGKHLCVDAKLGTQDGIPSVFDLLGRDEGVGNVSNC